MLTKRNRLFFILLVLVTGINIYIFFNRDDHAFLKQSSYAGLYPVTGNEAVKDLKEKNDSSILVLLKTPPSKTVNWQVYIDDSLLENVTATEPFFSLQEGIHEYLVYSKDIPDTFRLKAEYISEVNSKAKDRIGNAGITVFKAQLPTVSLQKHLDSWRDDEIPVTETEAVALRSILKDSAGIDEKETTIEKIKKLGAYLGNKLCTAAGNPTSTINGLSVFQQYKASFSGQKLWCGNYAQVFNLFARQAGIKSRVIHISSSFGSLRGNVHIFNEYFIPELKQWAAVDLLFNNIMYTDAAGKILNAVEVKNVNRADSSITVLQGGAHDSLMSRQFPVLQTVFFDTYGRDKDLRFYHSIYPDRVYPLRKKITRYLTKDYWFEVYSDSAVADNYLFYVKQLFLLLELLLLLFGIAMLLPDHYKRKRLAALK